MRIIRKIIFLFDFSMSLHMFHIDTKSLVSIVRDINLRGNKYVRNLFTDVSTVEENWRGQIFGETIVRESSIILRPFI